MIDVPKGAMRRRKTVAKHSTGKTTRVPKPIARVYRNTGTRRRRTSSAKRNKFTSGDVPISRRYIPRQMRKGYKRRRKHKEEAESKTTNS